MYSFGFYPDPKGRSVNSGRGGVSKGDDVRLDSDPNHGSESKTCAWSRPKFLFSCRGRASHMQLHYPGSSCERGAEDFTSIERVPIRGF